LSGIAVKDGETAFKRIVRKEESKNVYIPYVDVILDGKSLEND